MSKWFINRYLKSLKVGNPLMIVGLPGIGNVGKIAVDFLIDELKAKKVLDFFSYSFPNAVFINEESLIDVPIIEVYYKKLSGADLFLVGGDIQPIDDVGCYEFCELLLNEYKKFGGKRLITLGGVGLQHVPKEPKIYCSGNSKRFINAFTKGVNVEKKVYGKVGPIIGVSGVLLGMAPRFGMDAITLLAETYAHPMYLGIKGSREIIKILKKKLGLKINLKDLDKEIKEMESELLKRTEELSTIIKPRRKGRDVSYIG